MKDCFMEVYQGLSLVFKFTLIFLLISVHSGVAYTQKMNCPSIWSIKSIDFKSRRFKIIIWPHKTDVTEDFKLYEKLGISGFQIDRGKGQEDKIKFSLEHNFPYYVGHASGKGILYLKGGDAKAVVGKRGLVIRPYSLADPNNISLMKKRLRDNITATKEGFVLAYAFDDEISLGRFTSPCDVDAHPLSIEWFRKWLKGNYGRIERLNDEWGASYTKFEEVLPKSFEDIRGNAQKPPISGWNLSPWMDFRAFMNYQFASVLAELTRYCNSIDPGTPAGFVGGQGPSPWGGYDYALLARAVQWMEAYDVNGTNEILRSFWNNERRPRMQTFFSTKNWKLDSWFLWYYMLHGNQAVIAWPEGWFHVKGNDIAPHILLLKQTFKEVQGRVSEPIVDPKTKFDPDPIGIYYSQPSIQVSWVMDAIVHGKTWVNRKSSIDNENQSKGLLRKVWCKTLEDLGYQYDFISYLDVKERRVGLHKKFKIIILPKTICLSDMEAQALRHFVMQGGTLIADYLCGLMDEHGKGRKEGALDDLFGIIRGESRGYMNGKGLTEIDAELYQKPFLDRFTFYKGASRYKGIVVFERGTRASSDTKAIDLKKPWPLSGGPSVLISRKVGKGKAYYLNLTPLEYWATEKRFSDYGLQWRNIVGTILRQAGFKPRVVVNEGGNTSSMIESLWWKRGNRYLLGVIKNPTLKKDLKTLGVEYPVQGITGEQEEICLKFTETVALRNVRNKKHLGVSREFQDIFKPWEGNLYEVTFLPTRDRQ